MGELLTMTDYVDIIVPRGGKSLVKRVQDEARVPVLAHLDGVCHVYLDGKADPVRAMNVAFDAKMRRTGICGAMETLLVDADFPEAETAKIIQELLKAGCEIRGDESIQKLDSRIKPAAEQDWHTEYLEAILSVRRVTA